VVEIDLAADDRPVTLATMDDEVDDVDEVDASAVSARLPARRSMIPGRVYPFLESTTRRARLQLRRSRTLTIIMTSDYFDCTSQTFLRF
jgi:hypothetical protein